MDVGSAVGVGYVEDLLDLVLGEHGLVACGWVHCGKVEGFGDAEGWGCLLEGVHF